MAVKASANITLTSVVDIQATYRYYLLQSSTLAKPSKPTTNPPSSSWDDSEPTYTSGSTNSLYYVDLTVFSNGAFAYSDVSLSTAYEAAKEAYNKASAAQNTANGAQSNLDNLQIGGRNLLTNSDIAFTITGTGTAANYGSSTSTGTYGLSEKVTELAVGDKFALSVTVTMENAVFNGSSSNRVGFEPAINGTYYGCWQSQTTGVAVNKTIRITAVKTVVTEMTLDNEQPYLYIQGLESGVVTVSNPKMEIGHKATDWTPAPEDVNDGIADAQNSANANAEQIRNALLMIDNINAMIQTLVTGENGESLMTQTDTGWTFSMADIQNTLGMLGKSVGTLTEDSAETKSLIDGLNQSIADLGEYTDYIKFGVDGGKPCIYLGETDSVFKVLITNTDIRFMEGSVVPASISNQALNIETAIVNKEIRQGGFSWNIRANGNYSLSWKG